MDMSKNKKIALGAAALVLATFLPFRWCNGVLSNYDGLIK